MSGVVDLSNQASPGPATSVAPVVSALDPEESDTLRRLAEDGPGPEANSRAGSTRRAKRDPLTTTQLAAMVAALDLGTLSGQRDRAMLLVGFAGAFRRSQLAGLTLTQLERWGDGYFVCLPGARTDQKTTSRIVGIPAFASSLCPVAALDAWLTAAQIHQGALFRRVTRYGTISASALTPASVALIVKRCALAAGIPASCLAGHSLRAGHATTASANGAPDRVIMRQTGHRSAETLEGYIGRTRIFAENSARYLNLENP